MKLRLAPAAVLSALACFASPAAAEGRLRVAVLEYRAAVTAVPGIGQRLADRFRKLASVDVVDQLEARRRNASIDADVGRCAGEATCTARLGRDNKRIGMDEVLLLAMSQLGDLVLQVQRIEVSSGRVRSQLSEVIAEGSDVTDEQLEGWLRQLYPQDLFRRYGYISVKANVDGAKVVINGDDRGQTPLSERIKLPAPHAYKVELQKTGRVPFSARIDVLPEADVEVNAQLPELGREAPWYKRWYPWAILGGVIAGAGAGTAIYLTRPDNHNDRGTVFLP